MPKKASYLPKGQKLIDSIYITIVRLGLLPGAYLIKVTGRKSGKIYTVPLFVLHSKRRALARCRLRPIRLGQERPSGRRLHALS